MKYIAVKSHVSNYSNPISLERGDKVLVGSTYDGPEEWNHWVYCKEVRDKREGWVPEQLIRRNTVSEGVMIEKYTAKELNIGIGDILIGSKELNGWIWCEKVNTGEEGWIPKQNVEQHE
ncbi:SH3 domain-containing protein [Bacillus sp. C1]